MDANLQFWRAQGQSFFQRFLLWADVLDPLLLFKSSDEIRRTRLLLQNSGKSLSEPIQNDQTKKAFLLSLSSVHPDTDKIIPVLFRPPAFMPISLPLVIVSSLQLKARQTFFCQFVFHTYTTVFTLVNGNGTTKAEGNLLPQKQIFCGLGAISYAACIGALPLVFMNRYTLKGPLTELVVRKLLPAPLLVLELQSTPLHDIQLLIQRYPGMQLAFFFGWDIIPETIRTPRRAVALKLVQPATAGSTSAFTATMVRSPEFENGIEVMDRNGNVVGVSKKAGEKAVRETAVSRAVLFGTTFFLPAAIMYFVERTKLAKTPRSLASVRMMVITSVLTGMLPVSLSMYPQCGKIKRADLEPEILASTEETELFYNKGI